MARKSLRRIAPWLLATFALSSMSGFRAVTPATLSDVPQLQRLDPFELLLIEQPLDEEDGWARAGS